MTNESIAEVDSTKKRGRPPKSETAEPQTTEPEETKVDEKSTEPTGLNIYQKLLYIKEELKVPKNQFNSFGNYSFRSAEDILAALKPYETKYKVVVKCTDEMCLLGERYYCRSTALMSDVENLGDEVTAVAFAREPEQQKGMSEGQLSGSTSSFARKYALGGLLGLDDNKDLDSIDNRQSGQKAKPATKAPTSGTVATNPINGNEKQDYIDNAIQLLKLRGYKDTEANALLEGMSQKGFSKPVVQLTREQAVTLNTKVRQAVSKKPNEEGGQQ